MATLDRPKLRPLPAQRFDHEGQSYALIQDPLGAFTSPVLIPLDAFVHICRHFDGELTLAEIQSRVHRETGSSCSPEILTRLVTQLDQAMVLDGPTFAVVPGVAFAGRRRGPRHWRAGRMRRSTASCGPSSGSTFAAAGGAGPPAIGGPARSGDRASGRAQPAHRLPPRRPVYTWSYKELAEQRRRRHVRDPGSRPPVLPPPVRPDLKDFETPLGVVRTDRDYVERIARAGRRRAVRRRARAPDRALDRVPGRSSSSTCSGTSDLLDRADPGRVVSRPHGARDRPDRRPRGAAGSSTPCRRRKRPSGKKVAYIGGIDLCHVGPEFGDPEPVDSDLQEHGSPIRSRDARARGGRRPGGLVPDGGRACPNRWRVCGLAATYTMLHAIGPAQGRLLRYDQALDDRRTCCVSFASMVFHSLNDSRPGRSRFRDRCLHNRTA